MATEKVIPIKIKIDDGGSLTTLQKLQSNFDKTKRQLQALNKAEKQGLITSKEASKRRAQLTVQHKANQKALTGHTNAILKQNNALQKNSGFVAGVKKGVGQWATSMIGVTAAIGIATKVVGDAVKTIKEFDQSQANLASVLGTTRGEIKLLTEDAKRLGASTAFTAGEVAGLQVEFAKLGFSQGEILNMTEATLSLAAAAGTDLPNAATIAGSTLRAFGLESTETERVVDVMAKSFSSSSLDIEKFKTAMANVGPVAKSAGLTVEETTAMIGTLTDAGIDASTAGTGLRNVFLELSKQGLTFEEAMGQIQNATDKNSVALDLFGKRGAVIGTVLADNTQKTTELTATLNDAAGAAEEMAEKQLDTLQGSLTKLSSAWDGFILSLEDGESVLGKVFKNIINGVTNFISGFTEFLEFDFERPIELINNLGIAYTGVDFALDKVGRTLDEVDSQFKKQNFTVEELRANADKITQTYIKAGASADVAAKRFKGLLDIAVASGTKDPKGLTGATAALTEETEKNTTATKSNAKAKEDNRSAAEKELEAIQNQLKAVEAQGRAELELLRIKKLQQEAEEDELGLDDIDPDISDSELFTPEELMARKQRQQEWTDFYKDTQAQMDEAERLRDQNEDFREIKREQRRANALMALDTLKQASDLTFGTIGKIVESRFQAEIEAAEGNAARQKELAEELTRRQKNLGIAQASINGALAITKILAETPKADFGVATAIQIGLAAATTAAQIAVIRSQTFEKGGHLPGGVIDGPRHSEGGVKVLGGRAEVEGGEAIINRRSTQMFTPLLSAINEAGGGRAFARGGLLTKFQDGGVLDDVELGPLNQSPIVLARNQEKIVEAIQKLDDRVDNIKVVNVATDTTDVASDVINTENTASFG